MNMNDLDKEASGPDPRNAKIEGDVNFLAGLLEDLDTFERCVDQHSAQRGSSTVFDEDALARGRAFEAQVLQTGGAFIRDGVRVGAVGLTDMAGKGVAVVRSANPAVRWAMLSAVVLAVLLPAAGYLAYRHHQSNRDFIAEEAQAVIGFEAVPGASKDRYAAGTLRRASEVVSTQRAEWTERVAKRFKVNDSGAVPATVYLAWEKVVVESSGWDYCLAQQRSSDVDYPSEPDDFDWDDYAKCLVRLVDESPKANVLLDRESQWALDQHQQIEGSLRELCDGRWAACQRVVHAPDAVWRDCRDKQRPADFKTGPFKACVDSEILRPAEVDSLVSMGVGCDFSLRRDLRRDCGEWVEANRERLVKQCAVEIGGEISDEEVRNCITTTWRAEVPSS